MTEFSDHEPALPPPDGYNNDVVGGYGDIENSVPYAYSEDALEVEEDMMRPDWPDDENADTADAYEADDTEDFGYDTGDDTPLEYTYRFTTEQRSDIPPLEGRTPRPEPVVQRHVINKEVVSGEHPDKRIARHIGELVARRAEEQQRLTEALARMPNQNDTFSREIDQLATIGHDQYGTDPPITILSREQAVALARHLSNPDFASGEAMVKHNHTILIVDDDPLQAFGPEYLVAVGMHELGHATDHGYYAVETQKVPGTLHPGDAIQGRWGRHYQVSATAVAGIVEPMGPLVRGGEVQGLLWDEGRVDLRRVRTQEQLGTAIQHEGAYPNEHLLLTMTDEGIGTPHISPYTGHIAVPWKYAFGLKSGNGEPQAMYFPAAGLAAYALDLLEKHALPGLTEQMDQAAAAQDHALKQSIKDRVNGIDGSLYAKLARYSHTRVEFRNGLRRTIQALGIADETV